MKIDRRRFLKATVAAAGTVFIAPGCGDDGSPNVGSDAGSDATGDVPTDVGDVLLDGAAFFPLSVASGDPTPGSVVLWTRAVDPSRDGDLELALQVALDDAFEHRVTLDDSEELGLTAAANADGCVKVRVTGLEPYTFYHYRFVYRRADGDYVSRVGRTRTAPLPDADVPVRFAWVSCQDFNGKYYNTHHRLAREELDFVVHLGDYVYETTGDPTFQDRTPGRLVEFDDTDGVIEIEEDGELVQHAASLDNYRQLYRIHRGDGHLQRLHELFPMVVIWDDHEFADDCWGANSTMTAGREDEYDRERRQNASQAWFEYMPVDYAEPGFEYDRSVAPPDDIRIYRDIRWGANVHLVLTDLRLYRPDHLVPEDSFPGAVLLTQSELEERLGELPEWAEPYVDVDTYADGAYRTALDDAAAARGWDAAQLGGPTAVRVINDAVETLAEGGDERFAPIDDPDVERGLAYVTLGKSSQYSSIASRYLAVEEPYDTWAGVRYDATDGASEDLLGPGQQEWFLQTMRQSDAVWKVWGNEFTLSRRVVDTRAFAVPPDFQRRFLLSVEDWDGCPNRRDELVGALSEVGNVVAITGDIHAFFAGTPWVRGDRDRRIVEFVGSSLSSNTYQTLLLRTASADPALLAAGAPALALLVGDLVVGPDPGSNPGLAYAKIDENGFCIADVDAERFGVTCFMTPEDTASEELSAEALDDAFTTVRFETRAGEAELYMEVEGAFRRWNPDTFEFEA